MKTLSFPLFGPLFGPSLNGWNNDISKAGRNMLIQATLFYLPTISLSRCLTRFPRTSSDYSVTSFGKDMSRAFLIILFKWGKVLRIGKGGLGLYSIKVKNHVLLAKQL